MSVPCLLRLWSSMQSTFAELSKFASLDEARDYMIEKEII
jgi:hypothetical protein